MYVYLIKNKNMMQNRREKKKAILSSKKLNKTACMF